MINRKILLVISFALLCLTLSACSSRVGASSWPGIAVDEDEIYIAYNQYVYAVEMENGREIWRFPSEAERTMSFFSPPVLTADGQLLISGYDNILYSIDPESRGYLNWQFEGANNRYIASPEANEEVIFAANADGFLYALDSRGNVVWTFEAENPLWAQPTLNNELLILTSLDHNVYAINTKNG